MRSINLPYIPPIPQGTNELPPPQLRDGAISIAESGWPHDGYPELLAGAGHSRLYMTPEQVAEAASHEEVYRRSDGVTLKITRVVLPSGHDTASLSRKAFLADPGNVDTLLYPPIPDIVTGDPVMVDDFVPGAFQQYLDSDFTVFDQHNRPLPGSFPRVIQLLGLKSKGATGEPLGMPVGNGTFASPGYHPTADVFALMPLSEGGDELALLAYGRPPTKQSLGVWAPPGGFGNNKDVVDGRYDSWQTVVRQCLLKTGIDIGEYAGASTVTHTEYALSSPTTINAGLIAESHLVAVPYQHEFARTVLHEIPVGENIIGAQWLALDALLAANNKLRLKAALHPTRTRTEADQIFWSTHMRGLVASINKLVEWQNR